MKHNRNHDNAPSAGPRLVPVHFEFTHQTAATVCVAGCFNDWQPQAKALHPDGGGRWLKDTALPPGSYEYCFIVDGQWIPDPLAKDCVANPFGGWNSILKVSSPPLDTAHLAEAENLPLKNAKQPTTQRT